MVTFICIVLVAFSLGTKGVCSNIARHYKAVTNKTEGHSYGPIDFVYMINLDHRPKKYAKSLSELDPYGIRPLRFSAVNGWELTHSALQDIGLVYTQSMRSGAMGTTFVWKEGKEYRSYELLGKEGTTYFAHGISRGAIGCLMSHISILKDAYKAGYELIWIMEDDIEVVKDPSLLIGLIRKLDELVGRKNWDVFYTDRDYRKGENDYILAHGTDHRPDVETRNPKKYDIDHEIAKNLRQIGSRFATHSIIWTRGGIRKYVDYIEEHGMYLPIDMDIHLAPGMHMYSVTSDIVTNRLNAPTDNAKNIAKTVPTF